MATITSVVQDDHIEEVSEKGCLAMDLGQFEVRFEGLTFLVSVADTELSTPGSSPGQGLCVVFLGKKLYTHSAFQ